MLSPFPSQNTLNSSYIPGHEGAKVSLDKLFAHSSSLVDTTACNRQIEPLEPGDHISAVELISVVHACVQGVASSDDRYFWEASSTNT
eukprot:4821385-Pleurochrysis_carterae.AAC.1